MIGHDRGLGELDVRVPRALRSTDPRRLGSYELVARLGEGGQGVVFLGRTPDGRDVAVKLLRASPSEDQRARRRFTQELRAARKVGPFCTAKVIDAETDGDVCYIVSEYIDGPSLYEVVRSHGPVSGGTLDRLAIGMATALVTIHRAAVVHRDFKPTNVLIGPDGPRVIDFGIARLVDTGGCSTSQPVGTPAYMAPEQIRGGRPGPATDVFAWGCTVGHAANGYPPFGGDYIPAIMNRILHGEPDLGRLEDPLRQVVATCLHKDPARRPTAQQLLWGLLGDEVVLGPPPPAAHPDVPWALPRLDIARPNVARVYDYLLGGKDNFAADREMGKQCLQIAPHCREAGRAHRQFLQRVVHHLGAEAGVRQFLDIGSGLPTQGNVHEIAQAAAPDARVVYVDNDPIVLAHTRALLADSGSTLVIQADTRRPKEILHNRAVREFIDFSKPVGLLLFSILHHLNDDDDPAGVAAQLRDALSPGSYMALSHFHNPGNKHPVSSYNAIAAEKLFNERLGTGRWRYRDELLSYFGDFELLEPGLVPFPEWRPDRNTEYIELGISYHQLVGGLARKQ